jgi:hypothetical protein
VPRISEVLAVVSILACYGRHLAQTLEERAVARGFATIARFFGTVAFDTILAHLHRGLMRAIALERMLMRRAKRGRDLRVPSPRVASGRAQPEENAAETGQTAASAPQEALTPKQAAAAQAAALRAGERLARRIAQNQPLTLDTLPRWEEIDAEVRRSPVGRTIAAICRDFGVSPSLCNGTFWNALFDVIRLNRGNASTLVLDLNRREKRFDKEEWKHPGFELPEETRDGIRRVLGFFIGEEPLWPGAVVAAPGVAAMATGPP